MFTHQLSVLGELPSQTRARGAGCANRMTARVQTFAATLKARMNLDVILQDERLTSREAESRLAVHEKDWRTRKTRIDAVAAAIILQDYLDTRTSPQLDA